ncbi:hypothetical protein V1L54_23485 [Streptomyces sp. TRM 70361]|uniref:hypothetical protein n=1 Tax=Streptomyces sp. TRM 70361 TaxID=3116553 RepID=UPI002E7B0D54|nr:hypothetical protein [Streptomyces sp. TRM 70361]MEE1942328.1 hypothetical protein [Streptomyces sp. TRM 70361]
MIEGGSGPGGMLYACPAHARWLTRPGAPAWIAGELRALAAEEGYRSVACRLGQHVTCREDAEPVPPCEGVTVLRCSCPCHPAPVPTG